MGTLPWKGGGYQWRALRYKCLRLIHTIQASVKRRLKNYMFLSVCRSFFVEADDCRPCSARLSVQSIRIWMMKPLAQMAWAVGTCHLSGITIPFAKADHFRPCSVWSSVGETMNPQRIRIWMMKPLAQMAWAVGTCCLSGIAMPFAKADHFRPCSVWLSVGNTIGLGLGLGL